AQIMEAVALLEANCNSVNETNSYEVRDFRRMEVVAISHDGTFFDEDKQSKEHLAELYIIADNYDLTLLGPLYFNYHDQFERENIFNLGKRKIEITFPIVEMKADCEYCKTMPGFRGISTIHYGNYDETLIEEYKRLKQWGLNQGYE